MPVRHGAATRAVWGQRGLQPSGQPSADRSLQEPACGSWVGNPAVTQREKGA
jgi:hypothetical protein